MAGVKRGRERGNLGARGGERSCALIPFPFPFECLPRRLSGGMFSLSGVGAAMVDANVMLTCFISCHDFDLPWETN